MSNTVVISIDEILLYTSFIAVQCMNSAYIVYIHLIGF